MNTLYIVLQCYAILWTIFWFLASTICYVMPEYGKAIMEDAQKASPTLVMVVVLTMPALILPAFLLSIVINNIRGGDTSNGKDNSNDN